jgi:hypothetical protein
VSRSLREIAEPFVAAAPAGARVRTRLRASAQDEAVLWASDGTWDRWRALASRPGARRAGSAPGAARSPAGSASGR